MMRLEELAAGQSLSGIEPTDVVSVVAVVPVLDLRRLAMPMRQAGAEADR
jgi:hypothetical protein